MNGLQEMIDWLEFNIKMTTITMADFQQDFKDEIYQSLYKSRVTYRDCLDKAYRILAKLEKEVK